MNTKICNKCKIEKPKTEFYQNPYRDDGFTHWWKFCMEEKAKTRIWHNHRTVKCLKIKQIKQTKTLNLKLSKHNLTLKEYNQKLKEQNNKCAICGKHQDEFKKRLAIDHNHKTGDNRGLICHNCNLMLGLAYEDIQILQCGINYLIKWNK